MLNWGIITHPMNWVTVLLMVVIGMIALNLLLTPWHSGAPITSTGLNSNSIPGPYLAFSQ
jgi:hypothetical protein